jgi:HK97 family phage major capsid protein
MPTNTLLPRAGFRLNGSFHYDKNTETAGAPPDPTAGITKTLGEITDSLKDVAKASDLQPLDKRLKDVEHAINELKVGDPNSTKDKTHGYKHLGEFAQQVERYTMSHGRDPDERIKSVLSVVKTKPSGNDPFAVPIPPAFSPLVRTKAAGDGVAQGDPFQVGTIFHPQFASGLTETSYQTDSLLSLVRTIPIDAGSESITLDYVDDVDRSGGTIRGGLQAYWKSELTEMTGTKPKLRSIKMEPQELYAFAYASDKSLRNSPIALGAFLQSGMREAVDFKIGDTIVNGDGAGKPRGLINSPDKIQASKTTSQQAATLNEDNIAKMWKRMPSAWRANAVWLANQDVEDQFDLMVRMGQATTAIANQTGIKPVLFNEEKMTLKGRPIRFVEYCQTLGTVGDIILWAPQHYLVAVKTGQGPEMSMHLKFDFAQTAFRFIFEIDGKSEYSSVLTPYKGSVTRSAIVVLETR